MSTTLPDILATFDRCERDRQPITPSMWDALRSLARKADVDLAWYIDRHGERTVTEAEDAHLEAELARVGALSDDDCKAELAAEGIDYEASRKRMDVLLRTLTERTILKAKLTDTEADLATLRLEHESWGAIIDGLRASLATVTRERDEARKALATEEHNHELTIARRDDAQSWADSLANQIAEAAGHEIGEHSNLNNPWDNAQDGLVKLVRERDEARAERDNERASFARALVAAHAETANALDALTWLVEQEIPCDAQGSYDSSFITNHAIALRTLIAAGRMVEIFDDGGRSVEAKMKPEPDAALAGARS